jgi:flagellar basal-body rod protein FlgG
MNSIMQTAATGMAAQQLNVDTIANNLANVNTPGFKKSRIDFQDLLYQTVTPAGADSQGEAKTPTELQVGCGTRPVATSKMFTQGNVTQTGNALDIAIEGDGFFQVRMPDGSSAYTRDGALKLSSDGRIVTSDGFLLQPDISIPQDTASITISRDGKVSVVTAGQNDSQEVGQIELTRFVNPNGLKNIGHNLFQKTPASGDPITGDPTQAGFGNVEQTYLETSNVDIVTEMVNMIVAQRAYETNSKSIQTADNMLSIVNQLKR